MSTKTRRSPITVSFRDSEFTDADLAHLRAITRLVSIDLANTKITAAGLKNLEG